MRFLQTEWHKHERDRNNWEIERAEMKARIAKLEGEDRAEKRLHQVHLARIKILERALKKERASREGRSFEDIAKDDEDRIEQERQRGTYRPSCRGSVLIGACSRRPAEAPRRVFNPPKGRSRTLQEQSLPEKVPGRD